MQTKLSILFLLLATLIIAGCRQPVPSISVTNQSSWPLEVVSLGNVAHFKRENVLSGQTPAIVTPPSFISKTITITWYIVGAPKALPAIREDQVPIPEDWDGRTPLLLSFDQGKKWTAKYMHAEIPSNNSQ